MASQKSPVTYGKIWQIAYPLLVSVLMEQLMGLTDTAFLGRVGEVELGASALGGIFYIAIFVIGMGFCQGAQILMARRNGEGRYQEIGAIFYHALIFLLLLALLLSVFIRFAGTSVLQAMIGTPEVAQATGSYLEWRILGMFMAYVAILYRSFYVAVTHTRMLTLNSIVMVAANVLLDYLLVFGKCGLPALGVAGAAIASSLSEGVSMLFFIVYTQVRIPRGRYGLNCLPRFRGRLLRHVLGISVWTMLQDFISLATWFIFFLAIEHLGARELAISNIIRNVSSVAYMSISALSATAMTLTSNLLGEGRADVVVPMLRKTVSLGYLLLVPLCLLFALFPTAVFSVFSDQVVLAQQGAAPLRVLLACYILTVPAQIIFRAVAGTGGTRVAFFVEASTLLVYVAYVYLVVYYWRASLAVCWTSEYIYQGLVLLLCLAFFKWGLWRRYQI